MPLPFLTADRAFDEILSDDALPYGNQARWRRPYHLGPWRVCGSAILLFLASCLLFAAVIVAFTGGLLRAGVCVGVASVMIAGAVRLLRIGAWVSEQGLRRIGLFTTTTLPWEKVAMVRTAQQPVKWLGMPRTVQGQALLAEPVKGEPLRPLLTDHNADFLGRVRAFDIAADAVEGWAAEHRR